MISSRVIIYLFSAVAFGVFVFALTLAKDDPIRGQAIYWLGLAAVLAVFPKIQRFKIKDIEVELKKDLARIEKQVEELSDTFFSAIERVWQEENDMPSFLREKRSQHWDKFQKHLNSLQGEEKLLSQIKNTKHYLRDYKITPQQLKEKLFATGCYQGPLNNETDKALIDAIVEFQCAQDLRHVDGVFGPLTYQRLTEVLARGPKKEL